MAKYKELLEESKEVKEANQVPFKVEKSQKELEIEILDIKGSLIGLELAIVKAKGEYPLNLDGILEAIDNKLLEERRLEQAELLLKELF